MISLLKVPEILGVLAPLFYMMVLSKPGVIGFTATSTLYNRQETTIFAASVRQYYNQISMVNGQKSLHLRTHTRGLFGVIQQGGDNPLENDSNQIIEEAKDSSILYHRKGSKGHKRNDNETTILKNYYPLDQLMKRKTQKIGWLLRTTYQIITVCDDDNNCHNHNGKDDSHELNQSFFSGSGTDQEQIIAHPIGRLPSTLITKIPNLMNLWMKRCSIDNSHAAFIVEKLLQRLIDEREAGNEYFKPSLTSGNHENDDDEEEKMITTDLYNIVIEAWTRTCGQTIQDDLEFGASLHSNGPIDDNKYNSGERPGRVSDLDNLQSNFIILGVPYPNSTDPTTAETIPFAPMRAHDILNKMEEMAYNEKQGDLNVRPDTKTYSLVLRAWVRSKEYCSLIKMEQILDRLEEIGSYNDTRKYHDVQPTVQCFNLYLYALANRQDSQKNKKLHAEKAHSILLDLKQRYHDDPIKNGSLMPCVNTYNQVLSALARTRSKQGASQAQYILDNMMRDANITNVYPDSDSFNAVMGCWHKSGSKNASYHIEYLLNLMNGLSESVVGYLNARPDHYSVNTAIASIAKSNRKEKLRRLNYMLSNMDRLYNVKANTLSYNLILDAYAKSHDLRAVNETERLLTIMENSYKGGNHLVMPDSFSYATVIDTLNSRLRSNAGKKAEMIVKRMEKMSEEHGGKRPSTAVYNALMNCYASRGDKSDVRRLEAIIRFMESTSQKDCMSQSKPNIISYNTLLKGYAQSIENLTRKAEMLLNRMESCELDIQPDVVSYTTVISAFARSSIPGKARNAKRILDRMIDSYTSGNNTALAPTIFPFNACLNACAFTFNRSEKFNAFVVVVDTLVLIQKYSKADYITYGTVLSCWRNLIPKHDDRRQKVVRSSFKQCCKDGLVGNMVLRQLQLAAPTELYEELVGGYVKDGVNQIPHQWSRNIKEQSDKS